MKTQTQLLAALLLGLSTLHPQLATVFAQTTAFTYQGRLADGANPASGIYALRFTLFDAPTNGTALAGPLTNALTSVSNGLFTVLLDFGAEVFAGPDCWLELGVRTNGAAGPFTVLAPRQLITPAPLALAARSAATAATVTTVPLSALPPAVPTLTTNSDQYLAEGFEGVAFPPAGWRTGGNASWTRTTGTASEGTAAAVSGDIADNGVSWLEFTNNFPSVSCVQFDWKVSSEAGFDWLLVLVDSEPLMQVRISGSVDWSPASVTVSAGQHTIRWAYMKDPSFTRGSDCGWIDHVRVVTATGVLNLAQPLNVSGAAGFADNVGIGTLMPSQLLQLNVTAGHGEGMEIDSAIAGYAPAIYLNHTGPGGRNFRLASYGDNSAPGCFVIRDETAARDRLRIDAAGTVEVNGAIGVMDSSTRTLHAGIGTESGAQLINIGLNDGPANRFGGTYAAAYPGGFLRIDGRSPYPLFGFFARPAGSNNDVTQVASISTNGTVTATAFNPTSDRNLKDDFKPLDTREVLDKVAALPLSEWAFKQEPGVRHAGPMAQDFHAAFGLGTDDKHIATVDADGIALAAIQGLNEKLEKELREKEASLQALQARLAKVEALLEQLADTAKEGNR